MEPYAFAYLDDIIVSGASLEEHVRNLGEVLRRLRQANLRLNRAKCKFFRRSLVYLGHVISGEGIHTDPDKIAAVRELQPPATCRELRRCLGIASWYRRFVPNFADIVQPMSLLLKKGQKWEWKPEQQAAFEELKARLTEAPVLACPDFSEKFVLQTDASDCGLGAVLTQQHQGAERVIAYVSRRLVKAEENYSATEKECLAIVWAIRKLRCYLEGYRFDVVTDHLALKWLNSIDNPTGRIARWALELQQYQFDIHYRRGKQNVVADALSRQPLEVTLQIAKEEEPSCKWITRLTKRIREAPDRFPDFTIEGSQVYRHLGHRPEEEDYVPWKLRKFAPSRRRKRMQPRKEKPYDDISPSKDALNAAQIWPPGRIRGQRVRMTNRNDKIIFLFLGRSRRTRLGQSGRICVLSLGSHQVSRNYLKRKGRAGFARRVHPRPSAGSGEDHTRSVRSKGKQRHLVYEQRIITADLMRAQREDTNSTRLAEPGASGAAQELEYDLIVPILKPSPVHQAWEHQSPVRGPSYRHTDSLPTDPTWRPDLRGVEDILGRRDIVIRFLLSGLHPLAPPGWSELASKIWRRKARGERRNGSRESLLVLLDQSWVRSQVIRADFRAGTSAYPLTRSQRCPVVPDDLQIFCKQTLAGLRRRPRLEKLPAGPENLAALVRRTAEDFGYCFQIARAWEREARSRRWYSRSMNRELRYQEMRYHGPPALPISMEPSGRTGVEPPPNSPRRSTDSQSTEPNTVNLGVMPTWSQVDSDARDAALELEAARGAAEWEQVDWVAAPASWRLQGLYGLVPVSLLTAVFRVRGHACGRSIRVRIRTSGRLFRVRIQQNGAVAVTYVPSD
ncbi:hypothetical protein ACLKA7_005592 [Drosophila subpalustris]